MSGFDFKDALNFSILDSFDLFYLFIMILVSLCLWPNITNPTVVAAKSTQRHIGHIWGGFEYKRWGAYATPVIPRWAPTGPIQYVEK